MQDYRQLNVWILSHEMTLAFYDVTASFPDDEGFGLISQMRRAAMSIPTNIAEGSARGSDADFARFLAISAGSAAELDYLLLLSRGLKMLDIAQYEALNSKVNNIRRMLNSFIQRLRTKS